MSTFVLQRCLMNNQFLILMCDERSVFNFDVWCALNFSFIFSTNVFFFHEHVVINLDVYDDHFVFYYVV